MIRYLLLLLLTLLPLLLLPLLLLLLRLPANRMALLNFLQFLEAQMEDGERVKITVEKRAGRLVVVQHDQAGGLVLRVRNLAPRIC